MMCTRDRGRSSAKFWEIQLFASLISSVHLGCVVVCVSMLRTAHAWQIFYAPFRSLIGMFLHSTKDKSPKVIDFSSMDNNVEGDDNTALALHQLVRRITIKQKSANRDNDFD